VTGFPLLAHLRYQLQRHGWPAAVGLVLLALAAAWQWRGVDDARARSTQLHSAQSAARQHMARVPSQEQAAGQALADFYAGLPPQSSAGEAVAQMHRAAAAHAVQLAQGDYRLTRDAGTALVRYQISLPARAAYPQLRDWLADVMNTQGTVALEDLSLRRDEVSGEPVQARVRLTLFLRAD
jgi:hypothetical protein